jgi:sugar phosphate isomerase/epimerase
VSRIGLTLYTVREECASDFPGTLEAVAALGYEGVELHDLHGHTPERVRAWLEENRLAVAGWHVALGELEAGLEEVAARAETLGTSRLVVPWIEAPATVDAAEQEADRLERLAAAAADLGVSLCFHNHAAELRYLDDGRSFLDRLLQRTIELELDLGWAWWAGVDPVELLEHTRGRVALVHVKDFRDRESPSFCPVGDGRVGYERIVPVLEHEGIAWLLVEQDETQGPALEAAGRSLFALTPMLDAA